jgi:hypothetical protein
MFECMKPEPTFTFTYKVRECTEHPDEAFLLGCGVDHIDKNFSPPEKLFADSVESILSCQEIEIHSPPRSWNF